MQEISNNSTNYLLGTNSYKTLQSHLQSLLTILQWINNTSVIYKWGASSLFLSLVILFLVLPSDFIV